jgi:hypothetical protein
LPELVELVAKPAFNWHVEHRRRSISSE